MAAEENFEFVEKLIMCVQGNKCLYDKRDPFYFNKNIKERSWKTIGDECQRSDTECKHRRKLLRERFCKEIRRLEAASGSGMSYLEEWRFLQPMMFLKDALAPRRTRDNVEHAPAEMVDVSVSEESCFSFTDPSPTPPKKTKNVECLLNQIGDTIENLGRSLQPQQEPILSADEQFMKTCVCCMSDLPADMKEDLQTKILQDIFAVRREFRNSNK